MNPYMPPGQPIVHVPPRRRRPRRRFRWWLVGVPLIVLIAMWFGQGISPAITWDEVVRDTLRLRHAERCTELVTFAVILIAILLILRVLCADRRPPAP